MFNEVFSIVIPALNEEEHIPDLLRSIYDQNYRPIEVVLVDDGSTDKTVSIIKKMESDLTDQAFRIVLLEAKNFGKKLNGPAFARNLGIRNSHGNYILLIDADNVLIDKNLIGELAVILREEDVAGFRVRVLTDTWIERNLMLDEGGFYRAKGNWGSLAFKRKILDEIEFDSSLGVGEDIDLLRRLSCRGTFNPALVKAEAGIHLPHSLGEYRQQKAWQGKTAWLFFKKFKTIQSLLRFSPALSFSFVFFGIMILMIGFSLGYILLTIFFAIFFLLSMFSPVKNGERIAYILFIRLIYGSLCFNYGMLLGLCELIQNGSINPSRGG